MLTAASNDGERLGLGKGSPLAGATKFVVPMPDVKLSNSHPLCDPRTVASLEHIFHLDVPRIGRYAKSMSGTVTVVIERSSA